MGVKLGPPPTEKHTSRVFENRALQRIFGPEKDERTGC
jgi:hypothetical protein